MKASMFDGTCRNKIVDVPIPEIGNEEVLIKVEICGVCASEIDWWQKGDGGPTGIRGHEPVGTIEAIGANVRGLLPGDRVTGFIESAFAEYAKADYKNVVKVPEGLESIEAIGEPLACLVSGAERTAVSLGNTVAVVGLGFMGLGFLQLMKLKGAGKLIGIDVRQETLDNALRFGADEVYLPQEVEDRYKVTEWEHMGMGRGIEVAVEASGTQKGLDLAGDMVSAHGFLSIVGWHQYGPRTVNMELWNWKALNVLNAHERRFPYLMRCMKAGLDMIKYGHFNMMDMITHEFALDEVDKAYNTLKSKPEGYIKSIIRVR